MNKTIETKVCTHCQRSKSISQFYDNSRYLCIECERVTARDRMREYNATIRGKATNALNTARQTIRKNGYNVKDDLTVEQIIEAFEFFDTCAYCNKPFDSLQDMSIDHIVALSKNGHNTISNCCVVHRDCNAKKRERDVEEVFGASKAAEIAEYSAFLRADDEIVAKCGEYLQREIERKEASG